MGPTEKELTSLLNGLNPHVHVEPCSFEIVTAVLPPLDFLLDLLPPQAVAVAARPTTSASNISRFITDSFPIRPWVLVVGKRLRALHVRAGARRGPLRDRRGPSARRRRPVGCSSPSRLRQARRPEDPTRRR